MVLYVSGMSTTQRVESIHHFFKGFMNAKTSLCEFVQKYTRAIDHRANAERIATANDERCKARVKSTLMVERFFQKVYTDAKFKEVQIECFALMYCLPKVEDNFQMILRSSQLLIESKLAIRFSMCRRI